MDQAVIEAHQWQREFLDFITEDEKKWYNDGSTSIQNQLRKLDNPVSQRTFFKDLVLDPKIISIVEEIIGKDVIVFFSQLFFKPPHGGGPKPVHQDNFYFGCDDEEGIPILKIGGHMLRINIGNLDEVLRKKLSKIEIEWSKNNTLNYFKMLNMPLLSSDLHYNKGYSCVYSLTASEIPMVTNILLD